MHPDRLIGNGVPLPLVERIADWARRSTTITGDAVGGDCGTGLSDDDYVRSWRELRDETDALVRSLSSYLPARADVIDARPPSDWTDAEILRWRQHQIRLQLIAEYAEALAEHAAARRESVPAPASAVRVPYPRVIAAPDERDTFRSVYCRFSVLLAIFGPPDGVDHDRRAALERALGIPSGP